MKTFDWESRLDTETTEELSKFIKQHEESIHVHFSGDLRDRFVCVLNHYERHASDATAERKKMIEDTITYLQSFKMVTEMIGMASTHAEKSARLRGMLELLDSSIQRLRNEQAEDIMNNWRFFGWGGFSDYPYQRILEKFDALKKENEELRIQLSESRNKTN